MKIKCIKLIIFKYIRSDFQYIKKNKIDELTSRQLNNIEIKDKITRFW